MPNRMWQVLKGWKLPLAALFFMLVCFVVFYFSQPGSETDVERAIDHPAKPKLTRPVRKNAVRSKQAKKMVAKTGGGDAVVVKPYGCLKKSTFDEATGILRKEMDYDCDGIADECVIEELNEYGEPVRIENYKDCGKLPSHCTKIEYNEYGEETAFDYDSDCDGSIDTCGTFKRNDHGDIIESIIDKGCDGVLEEGELHLCKTYVYDEDGLIISERKGNCGEEPENCAEYEYDLVAGIRRKKWDNKCDGTVDGCQVMIYRDGYRNPDTFTESNCDGTWKSCNIRGEAGYAVQTFKGHEFCAKKYDELVKRNLGRR